MGNYGVTIKCYSLNQIQINVSKCLLFSVLRIESKNKHDIILCLLRLPMVLLLFSCIPEFLC